MGAAAAGEVRARAPNPPCLIPRACELILDSWRSELNHSETAFLRRLPGFEQGEDRYLVRWFTPFAEEFLCGHGLLACAIALHLAYPTLSKEKYSFLTSKGVPLTAVLSPPSSATSPSTTFDLTFPSSPPLPALNPPYRFIASYAQALNLPESDILSLNRDALDDVIIELAPSVDLEGMEVDAGELMRVGPEGVRSQVMTRLVSTLGGKVDWEKRVFAYGAEGEWTPILGAEVAADSLLESMTRIDQATGSTYSSLGPFWAAKLGKKVMTVRQPSHRGGEATVIVEADTVICRCSGLLSGRGEIVHPDEEDAGRGRASGRR